MFGRKQTQAAPSSDIETIIGPTANFRGTLQSDGGIRIDGVYEGTLESAGNLIISEGAKVVADIVAHNVSVSGMVKGDIKANRVEVLSTGRVWGDITVNSFLLDEGGFVRGQITMQGGDVEPPLIEAPKPPAEEFVDIVEGESEN